MESSGTSSEHPSGEGNTLRALLDAGRIRAHLPERAWCELVHAIARGDQLALQALYQRTHRLVFTLLLRITRSRESAEELTADVFHDVWRRAASYDPASGSVVGWVMNQARSRGIDRLRFDQRQKRSGLGNGAQPAAVPAEPARTIELEERGKLLRDALAKLTADERRAIEETFFTSSSYREAARRMNEPLGTVKTRIRSGLTKLRDVLSDKREAL